MENLHTSQELLDRMRAASKRIPSEQDIREQMVSFILGAVNSDNNITQERIEEVLARHEGRASELK
jgi:hypothetical protein